MSTYKSVGKLLTSYKMTKPLKLTFENMFKIATTALHLNRSHPKIVRDRAWKLQFTLILAIAVFVFIFLIHSIFWHDIKNGKFAEASKNGTMVIVSITITLKYFSLLKYQDSINELISFLENDYSDDNEYLDEDKETVLGYATRGAQVCKFWFVCGVVTSILFPLNAFATMAYYYWKGNFELVPMFQLTYPPPIDAYKNEPVVFWLLFLFTFSFALYAATMYIGFDPIVPIFMLHICGQLELLSRRITRVFNEVEEATEIENQLKLIIIKLQSLYDFVDRVKTNFSVLYEYNLKATTFLLPLTAFQIVEDLKNHWINIEFISFFLGCILHFFIPSYYSDLLMETSENFRQAIYSSGWEKCPDKRVRQIILFMMTRARIPMGIKTVFYEINLNTFAEMCRQSYGIFNLMNAVWE